MRGFFATTTAVAAAAAFVVSPVAADNFAVIVVGSQGFGNYRHHADGCHAYKTLTEGGIPSDNIIMMAYDDVSTWTMNPYPGKLFNQPTKAGDEGVDVYASCSGHLDYSGKDVTAKNFMAVLTGDKATVAGAGNGKVLTSTADDKVFINFVDHGGVGLIAMPVGSYLYADDLEKTIKTMSDNKMFKELVLYIEACESGSMFKSLPTDLNVYATTASNAKESSWGTYCPPNDFVNGKAIGSCLGDLYSVNWLQDTDAANKGETLNDQYTTVQQLTNKSHVMQFGTLSIAAEPITNFEGSRTSRSLLSAMAPESSTAGAVNSRDVALVELMWAYMRAPEGLDRRAAFSAVQAELQAREEADVRFERLAASALKSASSGARMMTEKLEIPSMGCYRTAVEAVVKQCGAFTDYSLKHTQVIANLCNVLSDDATDVIRAIGDAC